MKRSRFLLNTLKETPKEAEVISHILMMRSCMIKKLASGIYTYLPLGLRSIRKIENIVREELNGIGCQELSMPMVQPADLWVESGRWREYGKELLRFQDRKNTDYCLGPTHEEVITDIVRNEVRSYKDLPINLYQIQTKFRDEIRPRFGLMRGREFIMKDAYSFDCDDAGADRSYWDVYNAYKRIFARCGLDFRPVEADAGAIGGSFTHEFHVLAETGEDQIFSCTHCDYAANSERCEVVKPAAYQVSGPVADPVEVETPGQKTIEQLTAFLRVEAAQTIKALLYKADDRVVGAMVTGNRGLNEIALKNVTGAVEIELMTDPADFQKYGFVAGYLGPMGWPKEVPLYVDSEVMALSSAVAGANKKDVHLTGVVPAAHIKATAVLQMRAAQAGDTCPRCNQGQFNSHRGIEVGHVFKLGVKYSKAMKATYLDAEGLEQLMVMGCYGIGIGRTMASAIEQNNDRDGIIWPVQIAPFHVNLLNLDIKDELTTQTVQAIYEGLTARRVEVLEDDSALRPGPKFKDADLIGLPVQIVVGARSLQNGAVELKIRKTGEKRSVAVASVVEEVVETLKSLGWDAP